MAHIRHAVFEAALFEMFGTDPGEIIGRPVFETNLLNPGNPPLAFAREPKFIKTELEHLHFSGNNIGWMLSVIKTPRLRGHICKLKSPGFSTNRQMQIS